MARTKKATKCTLDREAKKDSKSIADKIAKTIMNKSKNVENLLLLPSPLSLMNCACAENAFGAFAAGHMVNIIGDSDGGKTILAFSIFAEANKVSKFDEYEFIFDDVENANTFDMYRMFGKQTADRIKAPYYDDDNEPIPSRTIEDFHCNIMDKLEDRKPFIYVLDSFDALDAEQDQAKMEEFREAKKKNRKAKGTYAMAKPKKASELLRSICGDLKETNSFLFIISQTRDNIDPLSFEKKARSGGRALKFYAHHEIWLAVGKKIKKTIKKVEKTIGNYVYAKVTKNKLTGKKREFIFSIYPSYGIDNTSSCVNFMEKEGRWNKKENTIYADDLGLNGTTQSLINQIEENNLERKLSKIVHKKWMEIEEDLKLIRKPKY